MLRKKTDLLVLEHCPECGNKIDTTFCYCGIGKDEHKFIQDHNFVPIGCVCGYYDKPIIPKVFFVTAIDMRPLRFSNNPSYVEWIRSSYQENDPLVFNPRTWLWLQTYEEAEKFVIDNCTDISEGGSNKWVVIEGIRSVIIEQHPSPQVFFEFVGNWETDGHYEKIKGWPKPVLDYFEKKRLVKTITTIG